MLKPENMKLRQEENKKLFLNCCCCLTNIKKLQIIKHDKMFYSQLPKNDFDKKYECNVPIRMTVLSLKQKMQLDEIMMQTI